MICQYCGHELNTGGTCLNPACPGRLGEEEVSELIPCPFCKESENIHITLLPTVSCGKSVSPEDSWKAMKCQLCGATGPMSKDPEEARKLWSTRIPAPAEVERLVEAYQKYIKLLEEECGYFGALAALHGFHSEKVEDGIQCRKEIESALAALKAMEE